MLIKKLQLPCQRNLSSVNISDCNIAGIKINGVAVDELLKNFNK